MRPAYARRDAVSTVEHGRIICRPLIANGPVVVPVVRYLFRQKSGIGHDRKR